MDYLTAATYLSLGTAGILILATIMGISRKGFLTLRSLFIPVIRGGGLFTDISYILVHPIFWIVALGVIAMFITTIASTVNQGIISEWLLLCLAASMFFAVADPFFLWILEGRYRDPLRFFVAGTLLGGLIAITAYSLNTVALKVIDDLTMGWGLLITIFVIAPTFEEGLKILGVVAVSGHRRFNDVIDGLSVGFAVGVGFALVENIFYMMVKVPVESLEILVFRVVFATLAHGSFSGLGGAVFGLLMRRFGRLNPISLIVPIIIATLLHVAFNISAIIDVIFVNELATPYYTFSPALTVILFVVMLGIIAAEKRKGFLEFAASKIR